MALDLVPALLIGIVVFGISLAAAGFLKRKPALVVMAALLTFSAAGFTVGALALA